NWYVYCDGKPVASADPTGTQLMAIKVALGPLPDPATPGERAAARAAELVGQGPKDCKMWVNRCYEGIWPMPRNGPGKWTLANDYDNWFADSVVWVPIPGPLNEAQLPPGTVAVIDRSARGRNGHVMIRGEGGNWYDASMPTRRSPSGRRGKKWTSRPPMLDEADSEVSYWVPGLKVRLFPGPPIIIPIPIIGGR
ncbi:MAG: hypothetical protein C4340_07625, partial [Armatimonadota bacterium]